MRDVSREAGISPAYLVALEHGHNPTTGRPPTPSPRIITELGRVLGIDRSVLLDLASTPPPTSAHVLLYQTGPASASAMDAARLLFAGRVDGWVEIVPPGVAARASSARDILARAQGPLGVWGDEKRSFQPEEALGSLEGVLRHARRLSDIPRLGFVFGANSDGLRTIDNPEALLTSEVTWERDVGNLCRHLLGVEPLANICVYREPDLCGLSAQLTPLTAAVRLIETHPHVAVQEPEGSITTGLAAVERILAAARPAVTSRDTWMALVRAAAIGFAGGADPMPPPGDEK
jgi:hypothetical protein